MANIGDRVQMLSNHWCRSNHKGVIVPLPAGMEAPETTKAGRVLVKFDQKGVGLGGEFLFVDEADFKVLALSPVRKARLRKLYSDVGERSG